MELYEADVNKNTKVAHFDAGTLITKKLPGKGKRLESHAFVDNDGETILSVTDEQQGRVTCRNEVKVMNDGIVVNSSYSDGREKASFLPYKHLKNKAKDLDKQ